MVTNMFDYIYKSYLEWYLFINSGTPGSYFGIFITGLIFFFVMLFCITLHFEYRKYIIKYSEEKQRAKDFEEAYDAVSEGYLELCNKYREKEEENDSSV